MHFERYTFTKSAQNQIHGYPMSLSLLITLADLSASHEVAGIVHIILNNTFKFGHSMGLERY